MVEPIPVVWEFYDLSVESEENIHRYNDPDNKKVIDSLKIEFNKVRQKIGDTDEHYSEILEALTNIESFVTIQSQDTSIKNQDIVDY